jgi:hypothetical protein
LLVKEEASIMGLWSPKQQIIMAITPKISAFIATLADLWIIIEIVTDNSTKNKRNNPYHRLLGAMCLYDLMESFWNFASTWPLPRGTPGAFAAAGTRTTCTVQGFFLSMGIAVPIYNASLSFYYLLVIRYNYTDETIRRRIEPMMHLLALTFSFGVSFYSISTDLFNPANLWCWIAPVPNDCLDSWRYGDEGNCERGDNAWIYRWAFYFAPLWACILFASK